MFDWNDLKYLLALDEGGTMKRAAELLNTNATTVSRHIKSLSDQLSVELFTRDKDGKCNLTQEGMRLEAIARDMQSKLDALDVAKNIEPETETIKITSLEFVLSHFLAPRLREGVNSYNDTQIHLIGSDRRLSLAFGEADLALRFGRPTEGQLIASKIATIEFNIWRPVNGATAGWVGLEEELDWTPEMKLGWDYFGGPPTVRATSFLAARNIATSMGLNVISPKSVIYPRLKKFEMIATDSVSRDVWSVIHESRRQSRRLTAVRKWARRAVQEGVAFHNSVEEVATDPIESSSITTTLK